jgi:hypothetical protein
MVLDKSKLLDLDECVVNALELFIKKGLPKLDLGDFKRTLVVGSGNAAATGRIISEDRDVVLADESSYEKKIDAIPDIDGAVVISASGGKHAPVIAYNLKKKGIKVILITNNPEAPAKKYADKVYVFSKNTEPYTYNTSTYMGMILAKTGEDPKKILEFIRKNIDKIKLPDFKKYKGYYIMVPEKFEGIAKMFHTKFTELFGRNIARDVETFEYSKHATTVVPSNELFISFGKENGNIGKEKLFIPLPKNADYGAMMAIGYYVIGKIQKSYPSWFKDNIEEYCKRASKTFGQEIKPIVE